MRRLFLMTMCVLFAAAACSSGGGSGDDNNNPSPGSAITPMVDTTPSVTITAPAEASRVTEGNVKIAVNVLRFTLADKTGQAPKKGEGHLIYYINVDPVPSAPGAPATTSDPTQYKISVAKEVTWANVKPGKYTFGVQLVNNDNTPLSEPRASVVHVAVDPK